MTRTSLTPVSRPDAPAGALALTVALGIGPAAYGALRAALALWEAVPCRGLVCLCLVGLAVVAHGWPLPGDES